MTGPDLNGGGPGEAELEEAIDWFLRLKDAPHSTELRQAFEDWLAGDKNRRSAWECASASWDLLGEVAPVHENSWGPGANVVALRARRRPLWRRVAVLTAAAAVAAIAWLSLPAMVLRLEADHLTQTAEVRQIKLADGSTVTLGGRSAISVEMDTGQRRLSLLAGEAFFDVAPDPSRPFIVHAGGVDATVLGTRFDVQLGPDSTRIELAEGALRVSARGDPVLSPGESVVVQHGAMAFTRETIAPEDVASWRDGRVFVADVPISTVIEQIRRYHPAWINVTDRTLAAQRVTGLYDLRDPDRALRALVQPHGGTVRHVSPWVVLISRW